MFVDQVDSSACKRCATCWWKKKGQMGSRFFVGAARNRRDVVRVTETVADPTGERVAGRT